MNDTTDNHNIDEIDCLEAIDSLYAYLDGELNDQQTLARFKQHLSHCNSCYTRSQLEGVISEKIKTAGKDKTPASLQSRLNDIMDML